MSTPRCAAIYARVSTEDQGKGFSLPTQIEACQKLATYEGYTVPETHILIDEGISGTTMDRPSLRRLRELITTKAIAAAIVYDPDRLSRNLGHQLLLAEEFERAGTKLLIVSHPLEQGPEGWLFFQMRGALAEYERAKILERTKRGLLGRAKAGHTFGGSVPLGYQYISEPHGGQFEIDEDEAVVVRRIFDLCLSGLSTWAIASQLTADRVLTKRDRHPNSGGSKSAPPGVWDRDSVYVVLTNETYVGRCFFNKSRSLTRTRHVRRAREEWIEVRVPAIIDDALFAAAKVQLARNKALATRNRKHDYLFVGGRLRCGRCGRAMSGTTQKGRRRYRCGSVARLTDRTQVCRGSLDADEAEARVWSAIERILQQPDIVAAEVARQEASAESQRTEIMNELASVDDLLAKCDRQEERWREAYVGEAINLVELKSYQAKIGAERASLMAERQQIEARLEHIGQAVDRVVALTTYCAAVRQRLQTFDCTEKRLALEALDVRVTWTPEQPLAIQATMPLDDIVQTAL